MNLIQILMTPNVVINNILTCILAFIESFLFEKFFTQLLKIRASKQQSITYIISASIIGIFTNFFLKNPISYITNLTLFFFFLIFIFRQNIRNSSIAIICTYITIFVSSVVVQLFLSELLKIDYINMINIPLYRMLTSFLIYSLFYLIYLVLKKRKSLADFLKPSLKITVMINLILGIAVIFINSYILSTYQFKLPAKIQIITILSLLLYFFISMYSILRTNKLEQTTQDLETQKIYNKTLSILHDNIRCFKHDFNNIVQVIGGYIELNDMEGLNKYYQASELGITMNFEIFTDLSNINFNIYEFTRILGILLDNAIEAAKDTDEKLIEIIFKSDSKKQIFIIENSCNDNNISTTKIFEKGYTSKENNSGIGLWKVHKILSKNTNIDLFTVVKNKKFKQELTVFY